MEPKDIVAVAGHGSVLFGWLDRERLEQHRQRLQELLLAQARAGAPIAAHGVERILPWPSASDAVRLAVCREASRLLATSDRQGRSRTHAICHCADGRSVLLLNEAAEMNCTALRQWLRDAVPAPGLHDVLLLEAVAPHIALGAILLAASVASRHQRIVLHVAEVSEDGGCAYRRHPATVRDVGPDQDAESIAAASRLPLIGGPEWQHTGDAFFIHLDRIPFDQRPLLGHLPDPLADAWRLRIAERQDGRVDVHASGFGAWLPGRADLLAMAAYLESADRGPAPAAALSSASERCNAPGGPGPLIARFDAVAARQPNATALVFEDHRIAYGTLGQEAEMLAKRIHAEAGSGSRVAIRMERTPAFIVAIVAALKAGCAYIPIDPATPAARQATILDDSGAALLLTEAEGHPGTGVLAGAGALAGSVAVQRLDREPVSNASLSDDIAYVIYTSGSTGVPKGVAVPQRNVVALVDACAPLFDLRGDDVWSLFHSMAFDFSVWEMWGSLLTGATLVIVPYWTSRDPVQFAELVRTQGVTVLSQTPTAFFQFMEQAIDSDAQVAVRLVVFGGEKLQKIRLLPWFDRFPESRCRLVNMYGITETTVHVTHETVTRRQALDDRSSVGVALPGWSLGICDPSGWPLPPGLVGEICVFGVGLAAGYLNRPELTASRFDTDPVSGRRRYRSGDRGRMERNGELFHLGRMDAQVKLRGFRIELDDIAAQIRRLPEVGEAVVLLDEGDGQPGSAVLRAFVTGAAVSVAAIRSALGGQLPEYMRPSSISVVERIPINANGKLDSRKLLADYRPEMDRPPATATATPGGGLQEQYRSVWAECFGTAVTEQDNFFDLGGNSLVAMKINQRLRTLQLPEIPFKDIYLHQNIAAIVGAKQSS